MPNTGGNPPPMAALFFDGCGLTLERVAIGREQLDHLRKDARVGCDQLTSEQIAALTLEIADQASCFDDQKAARCHIPGVQANFPETVVITSGHIRQIERSRAGPPQPGRFLDHRSHHVEVGLEKATVAEWKACADEALLQVLASRDAYSAVIEKCTAAPRRGKQVVAHRVIHHALSDLSLVLQRNRYAILRKAVQKISRAIEWIDNPQVLGVGVDAVSGSFLC